MTTAEGEFSMDASGEAEGGVTFSGPEGEARFGASASLESVPDWVPPYPGAAEAQGTYSTQTKDGISGIVNLTTPDPAAQVTSHYKGWFEDNDYRISSETSYAQGDTFFAGITGELDSEGRTVNVGATEQGGETRVTINYNAKAP